MHHNVSITYRQGICKKLGIVIGESIPCLDRMIDA